MAITSFKHELWSNAILESYKGVSVAGLITVAPNNLGGKGYHWSKVGAVTVKDYSGTATPEEAKASDLPCLYEKQKYFAIKLDDCDAVQMAGEIMIPLTREGAYGIAKQIDTDVLSDMCTNATETLGSTSAVDITVEGAAYDAIVDLGTALDKHDVPDFNRFIVATPEFINVLLKDKRVVNNVQFLENGIVQNMKINNMQVVKSNNLPKDKILACDGSAQGLGIQINNVEAIRDTASFSDIVRGLAQYGQKTLKADGIAVLTYSLGATE